MKNPNRFLWVTAGFVAGLLGAGLYFGQARPVMAATPPMTAMPAAALLAVLSTVRPRARRHLVRRHDAVAVGVEAFEQREPLIGKFVEVDMSVGIPVEHR